MPFQIYKDYIKIYNDFMKKVSYNEIKNDNNYESNIFDMDDTIVRLICEI